ncbi:MAG: hypothetical protein ABW250_17780 [Pyrinomonadaceae bacterium]
MRRVTRSCFHVITLLLFCFCAGSPPRAEAAVFRDRAAFNAAARNLSLVDFEGVPWSTFRFTQTIDGVRFHNLYGLNFVGETPGNDLLTAPGVGDVTGFVIYLPPGTTTVGFDQGARPMTVAASSGEKVEMTGTGTPDFVGFVSDSPIAWVSVGWVPPDQFTRAPAAWIDNLSFGQRRAGNEPPKPLLLSDAATGRAAAFDSVALTPEPFHAHTPRERNLGDDGATRVTLLVVGVPLDAPGEAGQVTARAVLAGHRVFDLAVESAGGAKNLSWLRQVTVRLPAELSGAGDVTVTVTVSGVESNGVTLRVD